MRNNENIVFKARDRSEFGKEEIRKAREAVRSMLCSASIQAGRQLNQNTSLPLSLFTGADDNLLNKVFVIDNKKA